VAFQPVDDGGRAACLAAGLLDAVAGGGQGCAVSRTQNRGRRGVCREHHAGGCGISSFSVEELEGHPADILFRRADGGVRLSGD